ncbi:MAG: 3-deoxy-manno-octulosonate cytidylyltransferase [Rickettsiales bacterium]
MNPIIIIPARMASTRLPNKPLALIGNLPMIVHVAKRASQANIGRVVIACDGDKIAEVVRNSGFEAIITDKDLPSGSDRIHQALINIDPEAKHEIIINVQGDMPCIDPNIINNVFEVLKNPDTDIATLAAIITDESEKTDPAVVKIAMSKNGRCLYFSRAAIPHGQGELYHHIGIYAYRRKALEKFVLLPPSPLERSEKLEQLRALEAGMNIYASIVDTVPLGVDTVEGLEKARKFYEQ